LFINSNDGGKFWFFILIKGINGYAGASHVIGKKSEVGVVAETKKGVIYRWDYELVCIVIQSYTRQVNG
jgi:hypothetical protein